MKITTTLIKKFVKRICWNGLKKKPPSFNSFTWCERVDMRSIHLAFNRPFEQWSTMKSSTSVEGHLPHHFQRRWQFVCGPWGMKTKEALEIVKKKSGNSKLVFQNYGKKLSAGPSLTPLRPKSDLIETSHCNIKGLSVSKVMRIENMITEVKFYWYFNSFSPLLL